MSPDEAAARLSIALRPGGTIDAQPGNLRAFNSLAAYSQFAREVSAEAGPVVLASIVRTIEANAVLTRRVA